MFVLTIFCIGLAYFFFTLHKSFNTKKTPSVTVQPLELKPLELPQNLILSQKSPLKPKPEQSSLYTIKKIRSKASENSKTQIIVTSVFENIPLKLKAPNRPSSVLVPSYTKPFHRRTISEFERLRMMLNRTQSPKHNIR